MTAANERLQAYCATDDGLQFIDVVPSMLDAYGQPVENMFEFDGVHLNGERYRMLASMVRLTAA